MFPGSRAWFLAISIAAIAASPATAGPPSPDDSTVPCGINLVGTRGGVADARGEFVILPRDLAQNVIVGCEVVVDFCAGGASPGLCLSLSQPDPDVVEVDPDGCWVRGFVTSYDGLKLTLVGYAVTASTGSTSSPLIYGDGTNLTMPWPPVIVGTFDFDGAQGVAPTDISRWLTDSFAPEYRARADYDCSRTVTPVDLAKLLDVSLAGGSQTSAANTLCH